MLIAAEDTSDDSSHGKAQVFVRVQNVHINTNVHTKNDKNNDKDGISKNNKMKQIGKQTFLR